MRPFYYFFPLALALSILVHTAPAQGADSTGAALQRFKNGVALFKKGKYPEACREFELSLELERRPNGFSWLGLCYIEQGRLASAYTTLIAGKSLAKTRGDAKRLETIETSLARIGPRAKLPHLKVIVSGAAEAANLELLLDGKSLPSAAWNVPFPVDPGERVLSVSSPGHKSEVLKVRVTAESKTSALIVPTLVPTEKPQVRIVVPARAQVEGLRLVLDGELLEPGRWNLPFAATPGERTLAVTAPGHHPQFVKVTVPAEAGTTRLAVPTLAPVHKDTTIDKEGGTTVTTEEPLPLATIGWIAGGVGIAAAIGGTFLYLQGEGRIDKWCDGARQGECDPESSVFDRESRDHFDTGVNEKKFGVVGWIGGGVLITGGVVLLSLASSKKEPATAVLVVPAVGPGTAGLVATGAF